MIVSFSEQIQGAFRPVIIDLDLDEFGDFSNPEFEVLPVDLIGVDTFGGPVLYNNNQVGTDGYLLLINGATFPPGVTHPGGFAGALLNFERMPGPDRLIDFDVFGGDGGATSGQGIVRGIKKDYFICGLTDVPEEDLEPPFERLSPTTGGYDFLMLNCVRGRDGRISRYRYRWGGAGDDFATACAVDHWGNLITVGYTNGNGFPIVQGAVQSEFAGGPWDGVLVKWKKPLICAITDAASFRPDCVVPGGIISVFGHWVGHRQRRIFELDSLLRFSTNLFGLEAYILGSDDRRYDCVPIFGSKAQSNIVVNGRVPVGPAKFCLIYKGVRSYLYDITVLPHKPACFPNPATNGYGAILRFPDNTVAAPGVLFPRGGVGIGYLTGLGPLKRSISITETTPIGDLFETANEVGVFFRPAQSNPLTKNSAGAYGERLVQGQTLFSGLAPGFTPGLQQVNFVVSDNAPTGLVEVLFGVNGNLSDPVLMEVGP